METITPKKEVEKIEDYDDLLEFLELCGLNPVYIKTEHGVLRFKTNNIIRYLVDYHHEKTLKTHGNERGLNLIWDKGYTDGFTLKEFVELYIHMGYSLGGFLEMFGDNIDAILRISYDGRTGEFIHKKGATEETIALINKPIKNSS
jgi:hypothetical protein